jgi:hypothetical protein
MYIFHKGFYFLMMMSIKILAVWTVTSCISGISPATFIKVDDISICTYQATRFHISENILAEHLPLYSPINTNQERIALPHVFPYQQFF